MQTLHTICSRPALALAAALAMAALLLLAAACGSETPAAPDNPAATPPATPAPVVINLDIANRASGLTREDLRVQQGDAVRIHFTADEPGEIHLHGYNLTAPVAPGQPGQLDFEAATAGAFGINFHIFAPSENMDGNAKTGNDAPGNDAMNHDAPIPLPAPVAVAVAAVPDGSGGANVSIDTEGWRWAPENVNGAHLPGEGHAHIYVDGVKANRVYGPNYHLAGLEPGPHHIRVTLNANSHHPLTADGQPLEAATTVTIPEGAAGQAAATPPTLPPVTAVSPMSVAARVHPDPLGGYNLQALADGFVFAPPPAAGASDNAGSPASGAGYGYITVDGAPHGRLYGPWQKLPALAPGSHTIGVALHAGNGAPYHWQGQPVAASVAVAVPESDGDDDNAGTGGHHHHGAGSSAGDSGHGHSGHSHNDDGQGPHDTDDRARAIVAEVHLGNLEVYP